MIHQKKMILPILLVGLAFNVNAQGFWKKLGEKASNAGSDFIVKKSTQKAEKVVDGQGNGKKETSKAEQDNKTEQGGTETKGKKSGNVNAYSKFDFVPGSNILFFENFEQDAVGEFPLKWFTRTGGEVVSLEGISGKWVTLKNGNALSPVVKIPENFTMEFDVYLNFNTNGSAVLPKLSFELFDRGNKAVRLDAYTYKLNNLLSFTTSFHYNKAVAEVDSREAGKQKLRSDRVELAGFQSNYSTVVHVSLAVQKERLRMWYNAQKVLDIPTAVAVPHNFNQISIGGPTQRDGTPAFYFSNFKLAEGEPDMRSKLLDGGKYVTNGILFDNNSAVVKPASFGVLKDIASALNDSGGAKFSIIGHTDNVGGAESNLTLSKKRAEAVKEVLVKDFNVDGSLLTTDGKGANQPVSENSSVLGKAKNRRVEFIKVQ